MEGRLVGANRLRQLLPAATRERSGGKSQQWVGDGGRGFGGEGSGKRIFGASWRKLLQVVKELKKQQTTIQTCALHPLCE